MTERDASKTALGVAILRAAHQLFDEEPKILDDPISARLLDPGALDELRAHPERLRDPAAGALRSHVVVRSRHAEDRLAEAVGRGVRQYVVLGAGLDSFAYRQPAWARRLRVYEVDHPASQRAKRERLAAAGVEVPGNVQYVGVDFESASLREGLLGSGLDPHLPAFFSCLGVLMYLTEQTADDLFALVASFPKTSELAFTFVSGDGTAAARLADRRSALAARAAAGGEPWINYYEPESLAERLRCLGFSSVSFLTPEETHERYIQGRRDGLRAARRIGIGSAVV